MGNRSVVYEVWITECEQRSVVNGVRDMVLRVDYTLHQSLCVISQNHCLTIRNKII